ncbi:MAG: hypothetical protein CVV25_04050 [Ignavibacteriae bacterium HGW-Ignavibacteriae-4]|jgi:hypothetical protein|nr:MAG: hypothetical protein CVV25_04050 [Ignavibacteriae bacterium HGW-Ignavibacteriae-4]
MRRSVNEIEQYLESEFKFLIDDYGFEKLENSFSAYEKVIYIRYESPKRYVNLYYSLFDYYLDVELGRLTFIGKLFLSNGRIRSNLDRITCGDIKKEEFKVAYKWKTIEEEALNKTKLYRKIMLNYLHEVLLGKKWIRLK